MPGREGAMLEEYGHGDRTTAQPFGEFEKEIVQVPVDPLAAAKDHEQRPRFRA